MIVVDSSVWIDHFTGRSGDEVLFLRLLLTRTDIPIMVGDVVAYEVLSGFRDERQLVAARHLLHSLVLVSMLDHSLIDVTVMHYRRLRERGITVGTPDIFIGTYCIVHGCRLLTRDSGFGPMVQHLGLRMAEP
jgi:predicted nucleic acid-binding protein